MIIDIFVLGYPRRKPKNLNLKDFKI